MDYYDISAVVVFLAAVVTLAYPMGKYMAAVFNGEKTFMGRFFRPLEKAIYRICGINEADEMTWKKYAWAFVLFNFTGILFLIALQMVQGTLPFNPQHLPGVSWHLAFNTAVSFVTNTNWQAYGGENTMSYLTQMLGLTVQNFVSAGIGMAAGAAFIRGFVRRDSKTIGNLWVDMTRAVIYILLPLSVIVSLLLISQGVIQNFSSYITITTIEGAKQVIPMGPAASQIAIKQLGSNGGGFFNANSAHPFENPTVVSNIIENFLILFLPVAFVFMFGFMIKKTKQGRTLFYAMMVLFIIGLGVIAYSEFSPNPSISRIGISGPVNMEGKETRFGIAWSALWSQSTTVTSNGSVNSMHDSYMPLSGMVQMFNIGIGEVIFGGVGVGLIGMLFYVILSMFVAGLMIGRTPEFMGKKFGPFEMIMAMISMLLPMISMVLFAAIGVSTQSGLAGLNNSSSHGLSEILYAFTSAHGNNGSAFGGLSVNTVFYNTTLGATMLIGRFATIIPALAVAGSLAGKKIVPETSATFPTTGIMFIIILISVILIMGALTFFPVYALGPVLEHFFSGQMKLF